MLVIEDSTSYEGTNSAPFTPSKFAVNGLARFTTKIFVYAFQIRDHVLSWNARTSRRTPPRRQAMPFCLLSTTRN